MKIAITGTPQGGIGEVHVSDGVPIGIICDIHSEFFVICPRGACQIKLNFDYSSPKYTPLHYDRVSNSYRIATGTDRVFALLAPCNEDDEGNLIPCPSGMLHMIDLYGGAL